MSLGRLRWVAMLLPMVFILGVEALSIYLFAPLGGELEGHVVKLGLDFLMIIVFSLAVFTVIERMQGRILRQNEELSALNAVGEALSGSLELGEAVSAALRNGLKATGAVAAEIIIDTDPEGGVMAPIRYAQGDAARLAEVDRLVPAELRGPASGPEGARFVPVHITANGSGRVAATYASVPLVAKNHRVGSLRLLAEEHSFLAVDQSERLLTAMGAQIAMAVEASHLFEDVASRGKEAEALYGLALLIASMQDIDQILSSVLDRTRELLHSQVVCMCLVDDGGKGLAIVGEGGPGEAVRLRPDGVPSLLHSSAGGAGQSQHLARQCPALAGGFSKSRVSAPVRVGSTVIGELCVAGRAARSLTQHDQELLGALADMAAIAINNARLLESQRQVAILEERERLSREMHDSLAQVLGILQLKARSTRRMLAQEGVARAEAELGEMEDVAHEAYQDVREAILGLRDSISPEIGLIGTIRSYLQRYSRQAGIATDLEVADGAPASLGPEFEVQLVRVIQEALTNVRKHANADRAVVRIGRDGDDVTISIEDNGRGFDPGVIEANGHQFGIRSMHERVERVGGRLVIESAPGEGTKVRIYFPLPVGGTR